ncbi:hypothetical protein L6452_35801 [Arctium lappa]|uniref:Uncharacterized protein n=1 Tax=Arctium lappa TaxID=4217 RepID=A0ACB8Y6T5_ARCLA|nr:hypothetical protein L6452_35801 [Arctium lappa]
MFDFSAKLPDHSTFVINGQVLPSVYQVGESSTKVGDTVSVSTDYYAKSKKQKKRRSQKQNNTGKLKKRQSQKSNFPNRSKSYVSVKRERSKERNEWRPKRKTDESSESSPDLDCNRSNNSNSDVVASVASNKQNLVIPYKRYSIKQLLGLSQSTTKSSNYRWNDFVSHRYSDDWFGDYHVCSYKSVTSKEKFCGNVRFGNNQFSTILGYGDMIQDKVSITKVRYVEGLGHNLFSIGQFCDKGLEKSWLWHRRLSHLNFRYIYKLVKGRLVKGLPELRYEKEHLCAACEKGKMKRAAHKPKPEPSTSFSLELLHMDLCGPMRTQSIGGKKYVLVIVDDYSRYTWVKFLRSKHETPEVLINFLKTTQDVASEQSSSEPVLTGVLASGQISPEPVSNDNNSDKASTSTSHLSELDLLFEFFYDEFLGSKLPKSVVVDRSQDSPINHPTTSDVSTELVPPVQKETQIQKHTPTAEVVPDHVEPEVTTSVGCTVMDNQLTEQVDLTENSEQETSTAPPTNVDQEEADSGYLDELYDQSTSNPLPQEHKWTKEHP